MLRGDEKKECSTKCELLKEAGSAYAYNKTNMQKLKSKLGSIVHTNRKEVAKAAASYGIGKIPLVGPELSKLFSLGISYAEGIYKEKKMNKLSHQSEDGHLSSEAVLAKIKYLSFKDFMSEIDQSYVKVRNSLKKIDSSNQELNYCIDYVEAFYRFYRVEDRMNKLMFKIGVVRGTLDALEEELRDKYNKCIEYSNVLIDETNKYTESHNDSTECLKHSGFCINDQDTMNNLIKKGEKAKLLNLQI